MNRDNHYEAAFEAFIRGRGVGLVPVDEARRSYLDTGEVKSPDFIIVGPDGSNLIVDVKGRQFPIGRAHPPNKSWQTWVQVADVDGLVRWTARFGGGFRGVLAFVYHILPTVTLHAETPDLFTFRDRLYLARGVDVRDYREHMTPRSPSWDTVHVPMAEFRQIVRPFSEFLKKTGLSATEDATAVGRRESPANPVVSRE